MNIAGFPRVTVIRAAHGTTCVLFSALIASGVNLLQPMFGFYFTQFPYKIVHAGIAALPGFVSIRFTLQLEV